MLTPQRRPEKSLDVEMGYRRHVLVRTEGKSLKGASPHGRDKPCANVPHTHVRMISHTCAGTERRVVERRGIFHGTLLSLLILNHVTTLSAGEVTKVAGNE